MGTSPPPAPESESRAGTLARWRWPLVVALVALLAYVAVDRACRGVVHAPGTAIREAAEAARGIAERFRTGRITTTFTAALPRLDPGGARLEVAAFESVETFTRTDTRAVFFDLLSLGTNVTEIRVPVTYRYHVRLDDPWRLDVREQVCLVQAPALRPSLPPAIHTDRMQKRSERGWLRLDLEQQMAELERSLTPTLSARATSAQTLGFVREPARRRVAEFVRDWLLREDHWRDDRFRAITVVFADEQPAGPRVPTLLR
jgi:hypothetical protein